MKIANFGVEEWLNKWEKKAVYDIAQSSIEALTLDELVGLDGTSVSKFFEKRKNEPLTMAGSKDQMFSNKKSLLFIKPSIRKTSYKRMERLVLIF